MDIDLHSTIDAAVWASEFERLKNECAWSLDYIDEGLMISWFSNAMYTQEMHDRKEIESMRQQVKELEGYKSAWVATSKLRDKAERELATLKQAQSEPDEVYQQPTATQWPADAPEWANYAVLLPCYEFHDKERPERFAGNVVIERPKPKDYCGVCGEWLGGPVECCGESHSKAPVTKDEAVAVRAARKPAKQKCKCCGQEVEA